MNGSFEARFEKKIGSFSLDLSLSLGREIGVLFGPSGAGKTLTLRMIAGLEQPHFGEMRLNRRQILRLPGGPCLAPRARRIGLVFQELALFPHLTVMENVAYGLETPRGSPEARAWIERLHLEGMEDRYPHQLSGGQKQRVALARALAPEPDLLLLDEPFSSLDGPLRRSLRRDLRRLHEETGVPLLYVTHQVEDICALGHRIFFLQEGRLAGDFPTAALWDSRSRRELWSALGWGNLIEGRVEERRGGTWLVWPQGALELSPGTGARSGVRAFIEPQRVKLLYPGLPVDPRLAVNTLSGGVVERYLFGRRIHLQVEAAGLSWQIEFSDESYGELDLREGAPVSLAVLPEDIHLLEPADNGKTA